MKLCVIGDCYVGKTALISRLASSGNEIKFISMSNAQFAQYDTQFKGKDVRLFFWDITDYDKMNESTFYSGAKAIVFVYDITRPETLDSLSLWMDRVKKFNLDIPWFCIGNKSDLQSKILPEKDRQLNQIENVKLHIKTSINTGRNMEKIMDTILRVLIQEK